MEATSTDKKSFQLAESGQQLGELIYENLFFLKAEVRLTDSEFYEVKPVGIFGTSITVTKNGIEEANLKMNWRGQIVFTFQNGQEYVLKAIGTFQDKYIIENEAGEKLIQFVPKFNWSQFNYNYDITHATLPQNNLLILLGVYAANFLIAAMSGAMAGLV